MPLDQERNLPFWAHLDELRTRLIRSLIAVGIGVVVAFWKLNWILEKVVLAPMQSDFITFRVLCRVGACVEEMARVRLQAIAPSEQFLKALVLSFAIGVIIAFPYIVWQVWQFIRPGLYRHEARALKGIVFYISGLFFVGVLFGYYVLVPLMMRFFMGFQLMSEVENIWRIGDVIGLIVQTVLASGLAFQLPVLLWGLSWAGLVTAEGLIRWRRYAILAAVVLGGVLTPSPDVLSQLLLALPLWGLYEVSVLVVRLSERRRRPFLPFAGIR
jgi:sec-independent protein translocase protein TatC